MVIELGSLESRRMNPYSLGGHVIARNKSINMVMSTIEVIKMIAWFGFDVV
jgi:hypothetical protein